MKMCKWLLLMLCALGCGSSQEPEPANEEVETDPSESLAIEPDEAASTNDEMDESEADDEADEIAEHALPTTIDGLVERFSGSHGLWLNGLSPTVEATGAATPQLVLEDMFSGISFDEGPVTEFEILEERRVRIDEDEFTALRVRTDQGPKIVLMRYQPAGWWTRVYPGE